MTELERIMAEFGRSVAKGDYSRLNVDAYTKHVKDWVAEEIIGSPEVEFELTDENEFSWWAVSGRNKLRAEQRKRLEES